MTRTAPGPDRIDAAVERTKRFEDRISSLTSKFCAMWLSESDTFAPVGPSFDSRQQREMEGKVENMMSSQADFDAGSEEDTLVRMGRLKSSVRELVVGSMDPRHREKTREMLSRFSDSGDEFVHRARAFDPRLKPEEIFQALRNLWIVNSVQVAFGLPVGLNQSAFAYSLLYPYTDNRLDAPTVSEQEKKEFNHALARRLAGHRITPSTDHVATVYDLVEMIESEHPRLSFPDVYESLLAIHRAQEKSLRQGGREEGCSRSAILGISVEKGGTSVLADGYMAKGSLTLQEADFAFGYGVFLQFIDDLQDAREDARGGHRTLFTLAATKGPLDGLASRLLRFLNRVLESNDLLSAPRAAALTELVRRSCCTLVLESIALTPSLYSRDFLKVAEQYSPVRFESIRRLHAEVAARQERLRRAFRGRQFSHPPVAACV
jgi:hypothetical protein